MKDFTMTVRTTTEADVQNTEQYFISAEDAQKVKYWYHATRKGNGFSDADEGGKHTFVGPQDQICELVDIRELNYAESVVLQEHLRAWPKESTQNRTESNDSDE